MKSLVTLFILLVLSSCGKSPLFNHKAEDDQTVQGTNAITSKLSFETSELFVKINWIKGPYGEPSLENNFIILVQNSSGELTDIPADHQFYIWGWMPSMGHGTADDGYTERLSKGVYIQRELYFNMGGDWEVNIELYKGSELIDSTKVELLL